MGLLWHQINTWTDKNTYKSPVSGDTLQKHIQNVGTPPACSISDSSQPLSCGHQPPKKEKEAGRGVNRMLEEGSKDLGSN